MKKIYWIIAAIIVVLLIGGAITYLVTRLRTSEQEKVELVKNFELDKQDLTNEYGEFSKRYGELQVTIKNDSLADKVAKEQQKIRHLLDELKNVKSSNAGEIRRLKAELSSLRKIMIGYIQQIDSLNRENAGLKQITQEVTAKYEQANLQISSLSHEKQNLSEKVTIAAQLNVTNISLIAKNKKGKIAKKMKDAQKLQVSFTVARNVTAVTGTKAVFVRLVKPDNTVLSGGGGFSYENRTLPFSMKKVIEYTGEEQSVTLYWDIEEFLSAGTYRVEVFCEGNLIGSNRITLE